MNDLRLHGLIGGGKGQTWYKKGAVKTKIVEEGFTVTTGDAVELLENGKVRRMVKYADTLKVTTDAFKFSTLTNTNNVGLAPYTSGKFLLLYSVGTSTYPMTTRVVTYDGVNIGMEAPATSWDLTPSSTSCALLQGMPLIRLSATKYIVFYYNQDTGSPQLYYRIITLNVDTITVSAQKTLGAAFIGKSWFVNQVDDCTIILSDQQADNWVAAVDENDNVVILGTYGSGPSILSDSGRTGVGYGMAPDGKLIQVATIGNMPHGNVVDFDVSTGEGQFVVNQPYIGSVGSAHVYGYGGASGVILLDKYFVPANANNYQSLYIGAGKYEDGKVTENFYTLAGGSWTSPFSRRLGKDAILVMGKQYNGSATYLQCRHIDPHNNNFVPVLSQKTIFNSYASSNARDMAVNEDLVGCAFTAAGDGYFTLCKIHSPYPYGIALTGGAAGEAVDLAVQGYYDNLSTLPGLGALYADKSGVISPLLAADSTYLGYALSPTEIIMNIGGDI